MTTSLLYRKCAPLCYIEAANYPAPNAESVRLSQREPCFVLALDALLSHFVRMWDDCVQATGSVATVGDLHRETGLRGVRSGG